ncbi:FMN-dependent NADH-azoreductase [Belnapia sp. F-4-1]|uniref:FMN-dependent NADH-azoreductase n=1 Tax=Belnapia sp. F-4-1 TaxID=1545443 RepID=UPI0005B7C1BB|nr:FMN-dependent NADH-azoreductase [Belnapia sp. F-4-1]
MTILHIDSSILGDHSVSRKLSAGIVARLRAARPGERIVHRDLGAAPVPHLSGATLAAARSPAAEHAPEVAADLALGGEVLQEFLEADTVVIGVAFYNFSISSQLKAWIDRILVAGQTFRYADGRPVGLVGGKRVILAVARGGVYGAGAPAAAFEHGESYLRAALGFIGITEPEVVVAEGLAVGAEQRAAAMDAAEQRIAALAA